MNPIHERIVSEILTRELPGVFITASSEIAPRIGEYERASTTVLNAYLTPVLVEYLDGLEQELQQYGWQRPIHIMMNNGGLTDTSAIKSTAVKTLLSGPAGGARGGQNLARMLGRPNLVVADMGGTSFDVTLVSEVESRLVPEAEIGGYPVSLPVIDIHSIGAGGGSIASVDGSGRLLVGTPLGWFVPWARLLRQGRNRADCHRCRPGAGPVKPGILPGWQARTRLPPGGACSAAITWQPSST